MESVRGELRSGFASTQQSLAELRRWVLIIALGMGALLGVDGVGRLLGVSPAAVAAAEPVTQPMAPVEFECDAGY
jgi:hypothetical protein